MGIYRTSFSEFFGSRALGYVKPWTLQLAASTWRRSWDSVTIYTWGSFLKYSWVIIYRVGVEVGLKPS